MNQHQRDLNRIHQSEIYGAMIFKTAEILSLNKTRKNKWRVLYQLEKQTLERLFEFLELTNQNTKASFLWKIKGCFEGFILALLPWKISMSLLEKGTRDFQRTFLRLENRSNQNDKSFYSYVYAHEKAIEKFAQIEQSNGEYSSEDSLEELYKLLIFI